MPITERDMKIVYARQVAPDLYQITYSDGPESERASWRYVESMLRDGTYDVADVVEIDAATGKEMVHRVDGRHYRPPSAAEEARAARNAKALEAYGEMGRAKLAESRGKRA